MFDNDGNFWKGDVVEAIHDAHAIEEVDVINFSGGVDHSRDGNSGCQAYRQPCALRKAAKNAIEDGTTVLAAAGNADVDGHLCCPALLDDVICVGGFVPRCTAEFENHEESGYGDHRTELPLAGWIEPPKDASIDHSKEVICTGFNCSSFPEHSCERCRKDVRWTHNVPQYNDKPDTLAPSILPVEASTDHMSQGTSWAVPFVTGAVAEMIAGAKSQGETLRPETIRDGIRRANRPLDKGSAKMFDAVGAVETVFRGQSLRFSPTWYKQELGSTDS